MKRTFINIAVASYFALGATLALVGCQDRHEHEHEHESTMNKLPDTSGGAASGTSGTSSSGG